MRSVECFVSLTKHLDAPLQDAHAGIDPLLLRQAAAEEAA
jgi:hypothetical protein